MTNNIEPQAYLRERNSKCGLSLSIVYRRVDELKPDPAGQKLLGPSQVTSERSFVSRQGVLRNEFPLTRPSPTPPRGCLDAFES
jgi:hypothetical protein